MRQVFGDLAHGCQRWRQIERLYNIALEHSAEGRERFIAEACEGDADLRNELESLLAQDLVTNSPLDRAAWERAGSLLEDAGATRLEEEQRPPMTGTVIARYQLVEQLGFGGMGVVYKAKDIRLRRMVALKFLTEPRTQEPAALKRFEREARAASALNHPNICAVYDISEHQSRPFLVLELLEGQTLQSRIRQGVLPVDEILDLAIQITGALDSAHQKGIIHRDIKPANIFITNRGQSKLLDFGLAKLHVSRVLPWLGPSMAALDPHSQEELRTAGQVDSIEPADLTNPGVIAGTVAYMSPEQARGEELDERTDLFSFGAVLYEMAVRRPAFSGSTIAIVFHTLLNQDPTPLCDLDPHVPARLSQIIFRALQKNRERRYPNALALWADLKNLKQDIQSSRTELVRDIARPEIENFSSRFVDSIAVLPFENVRGECDVEFLCEGMAESVINNLSQLTTLRVIPRTTAFRYKPTALDPVQAGRELGARLVLTGRVIERAGRLLIGAELIDCINETQLWGEKYDRSVNDVFAIEAEIAQEIANKLRIRLGADERAHLTKQPTASVEAYKLFLKAMYQANKWTPEGLRKGIEFLRQAIETDPVFPMAYSGLSYVYLILGFFGIAPPREAFPRAKSAALKALEIEENYPRAHLLLGMIALSFDWDWKEAENQLRTALRLAPNYANCHWAFGLWLLVLGRCEEAIAEMKRALDLDPLSATISFALGNAYYWAPQYDRAFEIYKATTELDPSFFPARQVLATLYARKRMHQEAFREVEQSFAQHPFSDRDQIAQALVYAVIGHSNEARKALSHLKQGNGPRYVIAPGCAAMHAILGERDEALDSLEESYQERAGTLIFIAHHPEFDSLHDHPRFMDLLSRIGLASV